MKILLTGATGFIGSHLARQLLQEKHDVTVIARPNSDFRRIHDIVPQLTVYNYSSSYDLTEVFKKKYDCIIHLAAYTVTHHTTYEQAEKLVETNIKLPSLILELAIQNNVKYFINTGTCFEYKQSKEKIHENSEIHSYNLYAETKLVFESILRFYTQRYKLKAATLKLFYPYGEGDNNKIITLIMKSLVSGRCLKISSGEQKLNFTYIKDIVDSYGKMIDYIVRMKDKYDVFNIGSDDVFKIKDVVAMAESITKREANIAIGAIPNRMNDILFMQCSNQKAKDKLDWYPQYTIEEALKNMYEYYTSNFQ